MAFNHGGYHGLNSMAVTIAFTPWLLYL